MFASLVYCPLPDGRRWRQARLDATQVAAVNADLAARYGQDLSGGGCRRDFRYVELKGYTVWGDFVNLTGSCLRFHIVGRHPEWIPSPAVARMLARLPLGPFLRQCSVTDQSGGRACSG